MPRLIAGTSKCSSAQSRGRRQLPIAKYSTIIMENITAPESRILSPFRPALNASIPREASLLAQFWVDPNGLKFTGGTPKSYPVSRFFEVAGKIKNAIPDYKWPEIGFVFCDQILYCFCFSENPQNVGLK